ncbi:MAG: hypothetical protein KDD11_19140 [Acidobacteria bacterium]|nr:hypothetical protein [Acidobacteriota bacterium]
MDARWQEIAKSISEQKLERAAELTAELRSAAQAAGDEQNAVRALVRESQLRTALGGYQGAVELLRSAPRPEDPRRRAIVSLFYAQALLEYRWAYGWEIGRRERVAAAAELPIERWTTEQITAAVFDVYDQLWRQREDWGAGPVGVLGEHLDQNDYPPRIRGTLRDTVAYLWVELLANTSLWSPSQSNGVYRLDLGQLLGRSPSGEEPPADALADPTVHPLLKISLVLEDLEAWHRASDRPEAAFEARLERIRRLAASFTRAPQTRVLTADLDRHLDELGRTYPWWSMGVYERARLERQLGGPRALAEARDLAREGRDAHPDSPGGQRCGQLVAALEAPSYQLQTMASDGAHRRSIQVDYANLEGLHFRAYRLDLEKAITSTQDYNLLPSYREIPALLASGQPVAEWAEPLPPTPDLGRHRHYVVPHLAKGGEPGLYVVIASVRGDFREPGNSLQAVTLIVGDLVSTSRSVAGDVEVTVLSGSSGRPVAGARVVLYRLDWRRGHQAVDKATTDAEGRVVFSGRGRDHDSHFIVVRYGDDVTLDRGGLSFGIAEEEEESTTMIYTDRSAYRPLQEVEWKVVAIRGRSLEGSYEVMPDRQLEVELWDANGEVVDRRTVTTDDFGSAAGTFTLPAGRLLGQWSLRSPDGDAAFFAVEEYKRPTFEVTLGEPDETLRLNRPARFDGEARYYFGLPLVGGEVRWRVEREPIYPLFGWWRPRPSGSSETLAAGTAEVDADGRFELAFTPEADEAEADTEVTYLFRVTAEVTDEGGETRTAERVFRLGFVAVEAKLDTGGEVHAAGSPVAVEVSRTDLDGVARAGSGSWRLVRLEEPETASLPADLPVEEALESDDEAAYRTEGDGLRPRWDTDVEAAEVLHLWADGVEVAQGTLEHRAEDGAKRRLDLGPLAAGAYRLHYRTEDPFGALFETHTDLVVAGEDRPLAVPLALLSAQPSAAVGSTARFWVDSGLPDQLMVLELSRRGQRFERRVLDSSQGPRWVEVPITEELRGGFGVTLTALRDHQLMTQRRAVAVPWDDRKLELSFESFRDRLRPGDQETWSIRVTGADGAALGAGAAEVLAYMYDRSLELFEQHDPPGFDDLYRQSNWPLTVSSSLGSAGSSWRGGRDFAPIPRVAPLRGDRLEFFSAYGVGGPGNVRGLRRFKGGVAPQMTMAAAPVPESDDEITVVGDAPPALEAASVGSVVEEIVVAPPAPPPAPAPSAAGGELEVRSDFSETAFWQPKLRLGADGSVSFEFTVPDSVTEWDVWAHALTRDLRLGTAHRTTQTVKELLVRPYLPRFLREGDHAEVRVVVQNAGETVLEGALDVTLTDPDTGEDLAPAFGLAGATGVLFAVEPGKSRTLTFELDAPRRVGATVFKAVARAGDQSDGEQRPLPLLPGRFHLAQSRFAALQGDDRRELSFPDMAATDDPSRIDEQLVVTLDAQLFYSVLSALPYLVDYPYECTEQTLNRFLSTGILSSLFDRYPAVAEMAKKLAERDTRLERWDEPDPNRRMLLVESPWLVESRGGAEAADELIKVLDPAIAEAQRKTSLAQLEQAQTSLGAFPWWPGGPPSPYMTLYQLYGFSKALEFGVDVPQDMVVAAWSYMHRHYLDEIAGKMVDEDCCWEITTFLGYVLSSYPDDSWTGGVFTADERKRLLEHSFRHWRDHSPLLKGYLALTLARAGRGDDARLVFDAVMDSAKTDADLGTYWAPEERSWLWYNDTVEGHAFALRTLTELAPDDPRRQGLVQWLMLDKKLNHWKSTRATAEVIYALVHYLEAEGQLSAREAATVEIGPQVERFEFDPAEYTGKGVQVVVPGDQLDPATQSTVVVEKDTPGLMFASATWHFSTERLPAAGDGDFFSVERHFFRRHNPGTGFVLEPLEEGAKVAVGDQVEVQITLRSKHAAEFVHLADPRGAGFEPESQRSGYRWDLGIGWYEEIRDSGAHFFFDWLPAGEVVLKHRLRVAHAGRFRVGPATVESLYAPEFHAYSAGAEIASEP